MNLTTLKAFRDELQKISEAPKVEAAFSHQTGSVHELAGQMKPGDVIFTAPIRSRLHSKFGKYIFKPISRAIQGTDFGHSSIYIGNGQVMEARIGEGTRRKSLMAVARKQNITVFRPHVSHEERTHAVRYAKSQEGKPYSWKALLSTLVPVRPIRTGSKAEDAPRHICSALIANAYPRRRFSNASRLLTKPVEIMNSPVLRPVTALEKRE